jgi:transposase
VTCAGASTKLLAQVVHGFALGAQAHHAYVFANRCGDRLKVLMFDGRGMWLCWRRSTRNRLQAL